MRKRTNSPEDIKDILNKVIVKIEKHSPGKKEKMLDAWRKVVGNKGVEHSRPVGIKRKVLTVEIDSSTWLYELNLKKRNFLKGLKKELGEGEIKDLRFRMGDIT